MDTVDYNQKFEEYRDKWGAYAPGNTEDDRRLVGHICSELEHEYPDVNMFQAFSWRFYYSKPKEDDLLHKAVKDFGLKMPPNTTVYHVIQAIKDLRPYARIYTTHDDDYGETWCVMWPDDPALRKPDEELYYKEEVMISDWEWYFVPIRSVDIKTEPKEDNEQA